MKRQRGTGSKRLRGNVWWVYYYHNGRLVPESTHTSDEKDAERILKAKVKAANTSLFVDPATRRLVVEDLIDLARCDALRKDNKTAFRYGTVEKPGQAIVHLLDTFSGTPALHIVSDDVDKYGDARIASGAKPATVNRELAILRHGFKLAVRKNLIPKAPAISMRSERGNERQGFIEPALFDCFLDELRKRDPVTADVTECAFFTLLRRSNVRNLSWDHVPGDELRLPGTMTKNGKPLVLPLQGRLLALIERRREARIAGCNFVFHRQGQPLGHFARIWRAAAAAVGVPGLLMHDLRRSGARTLIRAGVPEDVVLKLGNWKTRSMLTRYNVVSTDDLADAQAKLNNAFADAAKPNVKPLRRVS